MIKTLKKNTKPNSIEGQILERIKELGVDTQTHVPLNIQIVRGLHVPDDAPMDEPLYIAYYIATLVEYVESDFTADVPKPIRKQITKALQKGELCVYLSVIYHMLASFALRNSDCDFYMGYVETKWSFNEVDSLFEIPDLPVKNFHACVTVDEKVVDVCYLFQNEGMDALGDVLYGTYPDGAKMWGWKMNHAVPHLAERYAKMSGIDIGTFIEQHCRYFSSILSEKMNKTNKASI